MPAGCTSTPTTRRGHNERLEFLGDAVVNLIISEALYARHPDDDEGDLSARRAAIVSTTGLARLAGRIDLGSALLLGEGESRRSGRRRPTLLASSFEALAGAIYLDLGFERGPRLARGARRARARAGRADRRAQEPEESACRNTHNGIPAAGPSYRLVDADRAGPREGSSASRSASTASVLGVGEGPSRRIGRDRGRVARRGAAAAHGPRRVGRRMNGNGTERHAPAGPAAAARPPAAGLQVVRGADQRRVRRRDQRRRRAERLGQEQPRRRPPLGARRAGPGAPVAQGRGRHLGRLGQAGGAGHGRRHPRHRQRGRPAAGRLPGPRARAPAVPLRRERLPPQQAADPAARPRRPARRRAPRRQRVPVHRPGHGRPGARPAPGGAPAAVRGGRRRPAPRASPAARPRTSSLESEANLARVEDILAELRPQARRLAAQAEQQTSRADDGGRAGRRAPARRARALARGRGRARPRRRGRRRRPRHGRGPGDGRA